MMVVTTAILTLQPQ